MSDSFSIKDQRDYAWSYFQLHANQRMSSFNFFVVIAALLTTGIARTFDKDFEFYLVGVMLGASLSVVSFTFWKLDQRVRYLVKHAEETLKRLEDMSVLDRESEQRVAKLFSTEEQLTHEIRSIKSIKPWEWHLSYSDCFGVVYIVFVLLGLLGSTMAIVRWVH
jgi:hypothetical protein